MLCLNRREQVFPNSIAVISDKTWRLVSLMSQYLSERWNETETHETPADGMKIHVGGASARLWIVVNDLQSGNC